MKGCLAWIGGAVVVFVLLFFLGLVASFGRHDAAATDASPSTDASTSEPISHTHAARVGDMEYQIEHVATHATWGEADFAEQAKGEFIVVRITVTNRGADAAHVMNDDFKLVRDGATYDASNAGWMSSEGGFGEEQINPGLHHTANVAFDVPANTSPSKYALQVFGKASEDSALISLAP